MMRADLRNWGCAMLYGWMPYDPADWLWIVFAAIGLASSLWFVVAWTIRLGTLWRGYKRIRAERDWLDAELTRVCQDAGINRRQIPSRPIGA